MLDEEIREDALKVSDEIIEDPEVESIDLSDGDSDDPEEEEEGEEGYMEAIMNPNRDEEFSFY